MFTTPQFYKCFSTELLQTEKRSAFPKVALYVNASCFSF
jgi:hypothetical protein